MLKKISIFLLFMTIVYAKSGVDIGKIIKPSFSANVTITKKQFKLSPRDMKIVQQKSQARLDSNVVRMYTVKSGKKVEGYAVLVIQTVRTKKAAVLYVMDASQKIKNIEIVLFREPGEYKPNQAWQNIFVGKTKEDNLFAKKGIPTISGSTLSARAISDAARIAMAIVETYK